jgi:acetyl-CoA carboxylase carboxyltransferase component
MTKDKDEKAIVRARMKKTGESYSAARAQLDAAGLPQRIIEAHRRGDLAEVRRLSALVPKGQSKHRLFTEPAKTAVAMSQQLAEAATAWHLLCGIAMAEGLGATRPCMIVAD